MDVRFIPHVAFVVAKTVDKDEDGLHRRVPTLEVEPLKKLMPEISEQILFLEPMTQALEFPFLSEEYRYTMQLLQIRIREYIEGASLVQTFEPPSPSQFTHPPSDS